VSGYEAPSVIWGVHDDWGLTDHASLQSRVIPDGTHHSANIGLCRDIVGDRFPDLDPYHAAMGMVSQFNESDIMAFCAGRRADETWHETDPIERRYGKPINWVPSDETLAILRGGGR
jgi:hypothetical protein